METLQKTKTAIFCSYGCSIALETLNIFASHNRQIDLVVIEKPHAYHKSATQVIFEKNHDKLNSFITLQKQKKSILLYSKFPRNIKFFIRYAEYFLSKDNYFKKISKFCPNFITVSNLSSNQSMNAILSRSIRYGLLTSGGIIKEPLLSIPDFSIINIHPGKLPNHRSLDSLPWSILMKDKLGVTAHFIDKGIDTGPILLFHPIELYSGCNLLDLANLAKSLKPKIFLEVICGLENNSIHPILQKMEDGIHHRPMSLEELLQANQMLLEMNSSN